MGQSSRSALGEFYRRMRSRLGAPKAITATAHKLARIIYHLLLTREPYDESVFARIETEYQKRTENRLKAQARARGISSYQQHRRRGSLGGAELASASPSETIMEETPTRSSSKNQRTVTGFFAECLTQGVHPTLADC